MSAITTSVTPSSTALTPQQQGRLASTLWRIRAEYEEMPGLCLTQAQAQRLLGLEAHECAHIIGALVDTGFLRPTSSGFARA